MDTELITPMIGLLLEDASFVPIPGNLCIGRSSHCSLVLEGRRVSRRHADLLLREPT